MFYNSVIWGADPNKEYTLKCIYIYFKIKSFHSGPLLIVCLINTYEKDNHNV